VALSSASPQPGVTWHRALWSSDFPPVALRSRMRGARPAIACVMSAGRGLPPSCDARKRHANRARRRGPRDTRDPGEMVQDAGTRLKPSPHISFLLSFLLSLRLSRLPSPPLRSLPRSRSTWGPFAACALAVASSTSLAACAPDEVRLHAPEIAGSKARESPAKVELEPMVMGAGVTTAIESGESIAKHPDPSAVLTAGIRDELAGRALRGGEPGATTSNARSTGSRSASRTASPGGSRRSTPTHNATSSAPPTRASPGVARFEGAPARAKRRRSSGARRGCSG